MGDGNHRSSGGRAAQRLEHARLRLRVEVGRDFIQQKHGGIGRRRAGDGKELPLALRKHAVRAARVISVGKRAYGRIQPGKPRGLPRHVPRNARVAQRDLVEHCARHAGKMLLHAADARAALAIRDLENVHAADGDRALFRPIQPQQQLEHGALARAGAPDERRLLAGLHREGEVGEHRPSAVAEGHVVNRHVAARNSRAFRRLRRPFRLGEERIDALHARHRGLNRLDFHAEAFNRREDARDIVDDRDRRADGHAEQRQHPRVAGGRQQHHDADHRGVERQHDGGIHRVVEIRLLHRGVALPDASVVARAHVILQPQRADGADVVQRLRHLSGYGGDRAAIFHLRGERPPLHVPGERSQQRQHRQQNQRQPRVLHGDHREDREDSARIRRHGDHAGGEQRLHGVHVAGKARGQLAGVLRRERRRGQARQLLGHGRAERMGHLLTEDFQQRLLRGSEHALQREAAEIQQRRRERQRYSARQAVDNARQQQRRQQRGQHRRRRTEQRAHAEQPVRRRRAADGGKHRITLHAPHLPSGFHTARDRPERTRKAPRASPRPPFRPA